MLEVKVYHLSPKELTAYVLTEVIYVLWRKKSLTRKKNQLAIDLRALINKQTTKRNRANEWINFSNSHVHIYVSRIHTQ